MLWVPPRRRPFNFFMKLSLQTKDKTYTIESKTDDMFIGELVDDFRGLLVQAGFHPITIDSLFNSDALEFGSWNLEDHSDHRPKDLDMDRDVEQQITAQTI